MQKKIKIGVLGCAEIAQRLVLPSIKQMNQYELVAVASRDKSKAELFSKNFDCMAMQGYDELVSHPNIDAIYMPLPIGMHEEWGIKCLEHGKHVLSEKSLSSSMQSASKMVEAARRNRKNLIENFMFTYHSQHDFVRELIRQGEIGELRNFKANFGFPPFPNINNIRYNKLLGGGALLDAGAYTIKAAQMFLGHDLSISGSFLKQDDSLGVDISGGALVVNPEGIIGELAWGFENYYQCNYELWGSHGKVSVERAYTAPPGFRPKVILENQNSKQEHFLKADNHFVGILNHFYKTILDGDFEDNYFEVLNQAKLLESISNHA